MSDLDNATLDEARSSFGNSSAPFGGSSSSASTKWRQPGRSRSNALWRNQSRSHGAARAAISSPHSRTHRGSVRQARAHASAELVGGLSRSVRRIAPPEAMQNGGTLFWMQPKVFAIALLSLLCTTEHCAWKRLGTLRGVEFNDVPLADAPAFREAVETRDTLVAMRSARQMSPSIAASFGEAENARFHLLPITSREPWRPSFMPTARTCSRTFRTAG